MKRRSILAVAAGLVLCLAGQLPATTITHNGSVDSFGFGFDPLPGSGDHSYYVLYNGGYIWLGDSTQGRIVRFNPATVGDAKEVVYWDNAVVVEPRGLAADAGDRLVPPIFSNQEGLRKQIEGLRRPLRLGKAMIVRLRLDQIPGSAVLICKMKRSPCDASHGAPRVSTAPARVPRSSI